MGLDHEQRTFRMLWKFVHSLLRTMEPESAAARSTVIPSATSEAGVWCATEEHPAIVYATLVRRVLDEVVVTLRGMAEELVERAEASGHGE